MNDDDELPAPGALQKARSLPKLNIEEAILQNGAHPGHRYLTPQPAKRRPFLPPKPKGTSFRRVSRQNGIPEDIAEHDESAQEVESPEHVINTVKGSGGGMRTERTHENERLKEAKRDLVATSGPLTPKRKAPKPPSNRRRKSDTNAQDLLDQRRKKNWKASTLGPRDFPRTIESDSSASPDDGKSRLFYTPQPKRKQYNVDRNKSLNAFDVVQGSTRSPVERLANMKKRWGSPDSSDSSPSPGSLLFSPQPSPPTPSPRSPSSLSPRSSTSSTPSTASPKILPISPLASPLKVTNSQKSPFTGMSWQSTTKPDENRQRTGPRKSSARTRPQSNPLSGPVCYRNQKPGRKTSTGSRSSIRNSAIRKGKHRSSMPATMTTLLKSPDRSIDPAHAFGAAYQAEQGPSPRVARRSLALRDELFNTIILQKTEPVTGSSIPMNIPKAPVYDGNITRTNNNMDQENKSLIAHLARQKSGIDEVDGPSSPKSEPPTPGSSSDPSSPSSGYKSSPSPTSSPRHRPSLLRHMSSVSSMKSMFGSREVLNDLFLSERGSNKSLKAIAGFITGLILGVILFVGLYYGLKYGLIAAVVITAVSTLLMSLSLAFTVRGRCVALLMMPTLCTQRGRAAFLAIVVALLLNGPINNIFLNANEVSNSMSCSAELAYNQSQQIKEVAAEVFDEYVRNLEKSVDKLQDLANGVRGVFKPVEDSLAVVQGGLDKAKREIEKVSEDCDNIGNIERQCNTRTTGEILKLKADCVRELSKANINNIEDICDVFNVGTIVTSTLCDGYGSAASLLCQVPDFVVDTVEIAEEGISSLTDQFTADVSFVTYWEDRINQSSTFEDIQQAVEDEIDYTVEVVNYVFSIFDKLLALSVIYLVFRSYQYHTAFRTKDKFDNIYITDKFRELDEARKKRGKKTLFPLKKSERVNLIDVTSFRLSKPEKGTFRIGLVTLLAHICIASILILADNGLYWLLELIKKHGSIQVDFSGESGVQLEISGENVMSDFIRDVFGDGFGYDSVFDVSFDTRQCLPNGYKPNHALAVAIGFCYLVTLIMVLFQAYALRLRRRIAAYFYPERELERLYFIYNDTLRKRQTLFKFLKDIIKQKQKTHDATERVSLRVFLADHYPFLKKLFKILRIDSKPVLCFGCDCKDDGTFKQCQDTKCAGHYCEECLKVTNNTCTICGERFEEEIYDTIDSIESQISSICQSTDSGIEAAKAASNVLSEAGRRCRQVIQGAYLDCTQSLNQAYRDCKRELTASATLRGSKIEAICEVVNLGGACKLLRVEGLCEAPNMVDQWVDNAAQSTLKALQNLRLSFDTDVDFSLYWQERMNTSRSFEAVQAAVKQELDEKLVYMDLAFSIANKLLALSVLWLCFQSYQYHTKYRTKDRFDNFYITAYFKKLDAKRKEQGRPSLLPLKKSEKVRLIDLTSVSLSKPERGLFKLGLLTVIMHSLIAGILVLVDYGLYALLELINRHGQMKTEVSGEHSSEINVKGNGAVADFIRETFISSFEANSMYNSTIDSNLCLPKATTPNDYLSITIGSLYLLAILTVLFQAYALRLRRRIAAFYYPERELERLYYLYNHTLHKRQSLANFLQDKVKQHQHEIEASRRVSFMSYMAVRYPRSQKFFRLFGIEKHICLGCANEDEDDTFKTCATPRCPGRYCYECFQEMAGICSLCEGIIEEAFEESYLPDEVKKPKEETEICDWHYKYIDKK